MVLLFYVYRWFFSLPYHPTLGVSHSCENTPIVPRLETKRTLVLGALRPTHSNHPRLCFLSPLPTKRYQDFWVLFGRNRKVTLEEGSSGL